MKNSKRSLVHTKYFQIYKSANLTTTCEATAFKQLNKIKIIKEAQPTPSIKTILVLSHKDEKTLSKDLKISQKLLLGIGTVTSTLSIAIKVKILKEMHDSSGKNSKKDSRRSNQGVKMHIGKVCHSMIS